MSTLWQVRVRADPLRHNSSALRYHVHYALQDASNCASKFCTDTNSQLFKSSPFSHSTDRPKQGMETGHANSQPPSMSGFGRPEAIYHEQLNSNGEAISFLDSEDRSWHENPSEQIITMVGNGTFGLSSGDQSVRSQRRSSSC
jgi:hypothetical protein